MKDDSFSVNLGVFERKTAKDSIRKEQEILQIESGTSFENEALVKSTIGVSRKLRPQI